jgi:hypothetical protein
MTLSLWFAWHVAGVLVLQTLLAVAAFASVRTMLRREGTEEMDSSEDELDEVD